MRNCGEIIEKEINRKKVLRKDISAFVGINPQNLTKVLRKDSLDASMLEKFCQYLDLDPADFFDYRPGYLGSSTHVGTIAQSGVIGSANVNFRDAEIELRNKLIEEKDARISTLETTVTLLKNVIENLSMGSHDPMDK